MKNQKKKISVLGLGKLGACYAAFYASKGYPIIGLDINQNNIDLLNKGISPVKEPGLQELINNHKAFIRATSDHGRLLSDSDLTFIILPTPSKPNGLFSVDYVVQAAKDIGPHLRNKKGYHVFTLVSTVLPEDSRKYIIPAFEKNSGKKCGVDFGYVYSPSLIAIGDILKNLQEPDFLFLGAHDERSREMVASVYNDIYNNEKSVEHMTIESAELAKISLNAYVTMKITFANILGHICTNLEQADVDDITNALGKDQRVGRKYLRSGLGYGGTCFPRDNYAFAAMSKKFGVSSPMALLTHKLNDQVWQRNLSTILKSAGKDKRIGVLGISYRPKITLSDKSQALFITQGLIKKRCKVMLFEPLGHEHEAIRILGKKVDYATTLPKIFKKCDVIFISNNDQMFTEIPKIVEKISAKKTIIDPWGMFTKKHFNKNIEYISPGRKK